MMGRAYKKFSLSVYIVYKVYTRSGIGTILTYFLRDIIFQAVTLVHHLPRIGLHITVFFVLVLVFVIFFVVIVDIIKERTQQPKRGERERQVKINQ